MRRKQKGEYGKIARYRRRLSGKCTVAFYKQLVPRHRVRSFAVTTPEEGSSRFLVYETKVCSKEGVRSVSVATCL